jgi:hypothetical protein
MARRLKPSGKGVVIMTGPIQTAEAPLSTLSLFPSYPTREAYKAATGKDAPPFDKMKPVKGWADPEALTAPAFTTSDKGVHYKDSTAVYPILDVYERDLEWHADPDVAEISRAEAAEVNVPGANETVVGGAGTASPLPCRPLAPGEAVAHSKTMMGGIVVVNLALQAAQQKAQDVAAGKFTADDRALLERIAAKLEA